MVSSLNEILNKMENLRTIYMSCRSHFPFVGDDALGRKEFSTALLYLSKGYNIAFHFANGLEEKDMVRINETGHWINQNVVVRLYALLEYHRFVSETISIDDAIDGSAEMDLVRRLRNIFSHTLGEYNPSDDRQKTCLQILNERFNLGLDIEKGQEFPLSVNEIVTPLFDGCKEYVRGKFKKNESST